MIFESPYLVKLSGGMRDLILQQTPPPAVWHTGVHTEPFIQQAAQLVADLGEISAPGAISKHWKGLRLSP